MTVRDYASPVVRLGVALVFLLLGIDQFLHTEAWVSYLPDLLIALIPGWQMPEQFMIMNGIFDCLIGAFLLIGIFTRVAAALAVLHLCGVIIVVGYNEIAIRDFGILLAALAVALHGVDQWCLERRWRGA